MKIRIDQASLAAAAAAAAKPIPSRPAMPVLACALLTVGADAGALQVAGFDYDTAAHMTVECTADEPGSFAVPGRVLAKLAADLPRGAVTITVDGGLATLQGRGVRYRLNTLPVADYPQLPAAPTPTVTVEAADLKYRAAQAAAAVGGDDVVPSVLRCLHVTIADDTMRLRSTDRYKAVEATLACKAPEGTAATFMLLGRDLVENVADLDGTVGIGWDDNLVSLTADARTITLRQVADGEFPRLDMFLAVPPVATLLDFAVEDLADAARRAAQIVAGSKAPMRFTATSEGVAYSARSDIGGEVDGDLDCAADGDDVEFRVNATYLAGLLKGRRSDRVHLHVTTGLKPLVFTFPNDEDGSTAVLMPVRSND